LGIGVLFVFAQMVTVGLIALSATGGAIGGYYLRGKSREGWRLRVKLEILRLRIKKMQSF